ncbi:MAG: zinc-binding dehydrogenase [Draconibacterium sp.]
MKAVIIKESGARPVVEDIPVPKPANGEVLIKMHSSPINPSDLSFIKGGYGVQKPYPVVPGFEGSGTVVEAGKGILPKLLVGKNVACSASHKHNGCWAEYMITSANLCVPVSKSISLEQASMMFVNPMTALAFFDIHKQLSKSSKKEISIINTAGASALGRMVVKTGKKNNVPVISVIRRTEQVEILKSIGAKYIVNSSNPDFQAELKELAAELNATVIFDAVGGELSQQLLDIAPQGSNLFIYGRLSQEPLEINPGNMISTGNHIHGFWLVNWLKGKSLFQTIMNTRKIQSLLKDELSTTIYQKFEPENITEAIETYKQNMSKGKVLIQF